jgi:hypothetical protein
VRDVTAKGFENKFGGLIFEESGERMSCGILDDI